MGLKKLYCVDEWGNFLPAVDSVLQNDSSATYKKFERYFETNSDSALRFKTKNIFKTQGILPQLKMLKDPANIEKSLGNYFIGPFKYEAKEGDFFGADFETG